MPRTRHRLSPTQLAAWTALLRAHSEITRELERQLRAEHGLTLSDYDVLVQLAQAPGQRLRPVELARAVLLTRSGITRLVQGLERAGLVERVECPGDGRGFLAALFADRYTDDELETLGRLLERLSA